MNVAVVGAGLAGLRSAMLLKRAGHAVSIYEARERPGGRIYSTASGFEIGAEWVDEDHHRLRSLMASLGVAEAPAPAGEYLFCYQGKKRLEHMLWDEAVQDARSFEESLKKLRPAPEDTIARQVESVCTSEVGKWVVTANVRTDEGDEPARLGLQQWLQFRSKYAQREGCEASAYRMEGGGSALITKMIRAVGVEPHYGMKLQSVRESGEIILTFENGQVKCDAVVLALPLPCLLQIDCDPPLASRAALESLNFPPMVKACFTFADAFWLHEGWNGYLKTDLPIQQTWPERENANALVSYICGDDAAMLTKSPSPEAVLRKAWESMPNHSDLVEVEVKVWGNDEFTRGGFATAPPGSDPKGARRRDDGRIQISGEFCASWMGFMEGALESAEDATEALS